MKGSWHYLILEGSWDDLIGVLEWACPTACTCFFKLRPCVLHKTLSHMWDKLNLPMFLFNVGVLTLIKIDSLIFLAKPCPSSRENLLNFTSRYNKMRNLQKLH